MRPHAILSNELLAEAIERSLESAVASGAVILDGSVPEEAFTRALAHSAMAIAEHPRNELFRRFIRHGPLPHDAEQDAPSKGKQLTDGECASLVEYIHAHMVNRFKGDVAEFLACAPVHRLCVRLREGAVIPRGAVLAWGDTIRQPGRRTTLTDTPEQAGWLAFRKGADGLVISCEGAEADQTAVVHGIVEVKSMPVSTSRLLRQVAGHEERLAGGLQIGRRAYPPGRVRLARPGAPVRIVVVPSTWPMSRLWRAVNTARNRAIEPAPYESPPVNDAVTQLGAGSWRVTLAWSREAIEEAAYAMTFWYMAEVGEDVYGEEGVPPEWSEMTPAQAGQNAIEAMLYALLLRPLTDRHRRIATKLYNVYCFSYALGIDSVGMLWPEDFPHDRPGEWREAPVNRVVVTNAMLMREQSDPPRA